MTRFQTIALIVFGLIAWAQSGLTHAQVYRYVDENGITVLTNIAPDKSRYKVENIGCYGTCVKGVDCGVCIKTP